MAYIPVVSGGAQPVFVTDTRNGAVAQSANLGAQSVTNFQGPKLDFFGITANGNLWLANVGAVNSFLSNTLTSIQQTTTVAIYQVSPTTSTLFNVAVYPTGAETTATILAQAVLANNAGNAIYGIPSLGWSSASNIATFQTQNN